VSGHHQCSWPVFFSPSNFLQLRVCYFVTPSLTRRRVCNLLLLLVLASAVALGFESRGIKDHILLPQFLRLPQLGGPGPKVKVTLLPTASRPVRLGARHPSCTRDQFNFLL
jgi:hypothetical protein